MLQIDPTNKSLTVMNPSTLTEAGLRERGDLQALFVTHPQMLFRELGEDLILIGDEVALSEVIDRRVDLLALDCQGNAVVIELKRGNDKLQLLQAVSYAALISDWTPDRFLELMARKRQMTHEEATEQIEGFLDCEMADLNKSQRVVLMAEDFDYGVLATSQWLAERYGLDIRCYRMQFAKQGELMLMSCIRLLPASDLRDQAIGKRKASTGGSTTKWQDWDAALAAMTNEYEREFFERHLAAGCESYRPEGSLYFRHQGKRRWEVKSRANHGYVWQTGRFEGDEAYWTERLSETAEVGAVEGGQALKFKLVTASDFQHFEKSVQQLDGECRFLGKAELLKLVQGLVETGEDDQVQYEA